MKKRLKVILTSLALFVGTLSSNVLGLANDSVVGFESGSEDVATETIVTQELSEEDISAEHTRQLQKIMEEIQNELGSDVQIRAVPVEVEPIRGRSHMFTGSRSTLLRHERRWTPWRNVGSHGYILSANQGLHINPGGGASISVSLGFSWGPVNMSVSPGTVASTGGIIVRPSSAQAGKRVRPQIRNEVDRYEYRIEVYRYNTWTRLSNQTVTTLRTNQVRLVLSP